MKKHILIHSKFAIGLLLAALIASAGCQKSGSADNAPMTQQKVVNDKTLPPGWKKIEAEKGTISMSIAPGWKSFDFTSGEFEKMMSDAAKTDPELKGMEGQMKAMAENKMFKLFIFKNPEPNIPFAPTANLIVTASGGASLDDLVKANVEQMKTMTGGKTATDPVQFDNGDSGQVLTWVNHATTASGVIDVDTWTYFMVKGDNAYILTIGVPAKSSKELHDEAQTIAKSLDVK